MVVFILIFFASVIVVSVTAVVGFSIYLKRKTKPLESNNQRQFVDAVPPYRSLFAPDDEEVRAQEREAQMKFEAELKQAEQKIVFERAERVREYKKIWRDAPTKQNTIELLRLAAESENAEVFSQTAENVIQVLLHEQAGNLTAKDLADLLDSHVSTLPQQERISGAAFWLKQEIEKLRRNSK